MNGSPGVLEPLKFMLNFSAKHAVNIHKYGAVLVLHFVLHFVLQK